MWKVGSKMGWKGVWVCMTKEASERRCGMAEEGGSGGWI